MTFSWSSIYKVKLSSIASLDGKSKEEIKEKLSIALNKFLNNDFILMEENLVKLDTNNHE